MVLDRFPLRRRRLRIERARKKKEIGRQLSAEEDFRFAPTLQNNGMDSDETVLRMVVYANFYASIPLRHDLFRGPFDEMFGFEGNRMCRVFAGEKILRLESEESDLRSDPETEEW